MQVRTLRSSKLMILVVSTMKSCKNKSIVQNRSARSINICYVSRDYLVLITLRLFLQVSLLECQGYDRSIVLHNFLPFPVQDFFFVFLRLIRDFAQMAASIWVTSHNSKHQLQCLLDTITNVLIITSTEQSSNAIVTIVGWTSFFFYIYI